jgi:hypothetical protein
MENATLDHLIQSAENIESSEDQIVMQNMKSPIPTLKTTEII